MATLTLFEQEKMARKYGVKEFYPNTETKTQFTDKFEVIRGMQNIRYTSTLWTPECWSSLAELLDRFDNCQNPKYKRLLWQLVVGFNDSPSKVSGEYVKESYWRGFHSLNDLITYTSLNDYKYTVRYLQDCIKSLDFSKTSAVIWEGVYITPCMLDAVLSVFFENKNLEACINKVFNTTLTDFKFNKTEVIGGDKYTIKSPKDYLIKYVRDDVFRQIRQGKAPDTSEVFQTVMAIE